MKTVDPQHRSTEIEKEIFVGNDPFTRLAILISNIANPLFIALPLFLLVALHSAPTIWQGLLWWVITVLGMTVAPYLFILRGVRSGKYSDRHVSDRKQRLIPLSFGLGCMIATYIVLIFLHASAALLATSTAVIIVLAACIAITQKWKVSLHAAGMAGAVTTLSFLFSPLCLLLGLLIIVIGWARWQVRAHTPLQTLAGTVLAACIVAITFKLFGLY